MARSQSERGSPPLFLGHLAPDVSGERVRSKIESTHHFFTNLSERERELFAIVTEDISLQGTAGLQNVKRKLWDTKATFKKLSAIFTLGQIALNTYTVSNMFLKPYVSEDAQFDSCATGDTSSACEYSYVRYVLSSRVLLGIEACCSVSILTILSWSTLRLLTSKNPSVNVRLHYFVLMMLPKLAAKLSFVTMLHVANVERLKSFILRGEFECVGTLCLDSLKRQAREVKHNTRSSLRQIVPVSQENSDDEALGPRFISSRSCHILGFICSGLILAAALQALLLKLSIMRFVWMFSYTEWDIGMWVLFFGFVNQLSGVSLSSEVEMLRILLFKFGGEDAKWGPQQIQACSTYFRLLATRMVEQTGRFRALVLMWTITSADLQSLLLGHQRLKEQVAVRAEQMEMFLMLNRCGDLEHLRDKLIKNFCTVQQTLEDTLLRIPPSDRLQLLNKLQSKAIGQLRLAARVQEHIWEWTEAQVLIDQNGPVSNQASIGSCESILRERDESFIT